MLAVIMQAEKREDQLVVYEMDDDVEKKANGSRI